MLPKQEAKNVALWGSDRRNGAGAAAATEKSELARRFALHSEPRWRMPRRGSPPQLPADVCVNLKHGVAG